MLLTLRLVGLGFEIAAAKREPDEKSESCKALQNISFLDIFHYGFSYMGLLTGEYELFFKFTYELLNTAGQKSLPKQNHFAIKIRERF